MQIEPQEISSRDIPVKKGRDKECEPTNVGSTLPDVGYHRGIILMCVYSFCIDCIKWLGLCFSCFTLH